MGSPCIDDFNDFYDPRIKQGNLARRAPPHRPCTDLDLRARRQGRAGRVLRRARVRCHRWSTSPARAGVRTLDPANRSLYVDTNVTAARSICSKPRASGTGWAGSCSRRVSSVYGLCSDRAVSRRRGAASRRSAPTPRPNLPGEQFCASYAHLYGFRAVCLRFFNGVRPPAAARPGHPPVHPAHSHDGQAIDQFTATVP